MVVSLDLNPNKAAIGKPLFLFVIRASTMWTDRQPGRRRKLMQADRVEVSWDNEKSKWQVRIEVGDEVVRRHCDLPPEADEQSLRAAAQKTVADEGYENAANVTILRSRAV
jgi:hypothetical protein